MKLKLNDLFLYSLLAVGFCAPVSITAAEIFMIIAFAIWIVFAVRNKISLKDSFSSSMTLPIAVFVVWHFIAALLGIDPMHSVQDFSKAWIILIFFAAMNGYREVYPLRMGAGFYAGGAAFAATYAIVMTIMHRYMGHNMDFRASSFSGSYMHAGGLFMMGVITAAGIVAYRFKNEGSDNTPKYLYLGGFLVISAGLLFTFTRGSWVAALAGLAILCFLTDKRFFLAMLILVSLTGAFAWNTSYMHRLRDSFKLQDGTSQMERVYMWKAGLAMIKDRPLTGIGTGDLEKIYPRYKDPRAVEPNAGHVHNNLMQIAVIDGIPGLAAFLWIFGAFWFHLYRGIQKTNNAVFKYVLIAGFAISVSFFINGFFEYNFFSSQVALAFWYLMGLCMAAIRLEKTGIKNVK
jgi:O-antigen ligase